MDRTSCRARKSVTTVAALVGLTTALALAVPSAASAAGHHDRNCGNWDHSDQAFGAPFDGHNRHRAGGFHTTAQPRDDRDGDDRMGNRDDRRDGARMNDDRRDDRDGNDRVGNRDDRRDDRDGDRRGFAADRDDRRGDDQRDDRMGDREPSFRDGEISRDEGGDRNCGNFDHQGKQMYIPPGLFEDPK